MTILVKFVLFMLLVVNSKEQLAGEDGLYERMRHFETLSDVSIKQRLVKRSLQNPRYQMKTVELDTLGRKFKLFLQPKVELFHAQFKAFSVDSKGNKNPIGIDVNSFFKGHVYGEAHSEVSAYWEGDALNARIETSDDTYHIEPSWRHLPESENYSMISYKESDMIQSDTERTKNFCKSLKPPSLKNLKLVPPTHQPPSQSESENLTDSQSGNERKKRALFTPSRDTCPLGLTADYLFFKNMGRGSLSDTTSYLIALIERVEALYRRTTFDDTFKKFGFEIKEILVHEAATSTVGDEIHYNMLREEWDAKEFLDHFSRGPHYRDFCLSHVFTYQSFQGGVLGLAYIGSPRTYSIGGVCSEAYYQDGWIQSLNTGWSSYRNRYGHKITSREGDLVTAHEFGHNWGSEHDADTRECSPNSFNGGKFLMFPYSVSGYERNNQYFSPCSKKSIAAVLRSKSDKCFIKPDPQHPYCGNNLVEKGEECDAGIAGKRDADQCCDKNCRLKFDALCSDSNSACCERCKHAPRGKVCQRAYDMDVSCEGDATCTGGSSTCPKPEPKADGSPCIDRGLCKKGQCLPFCRTKGMIPCACDDPVTSCLWCCQKDELHLCKPYLDTNDTSTELADGRPCIYGICNKGTCERQVQDMVERFWSVIEHLTPSLFLRFMKDNIVLTVVLLSMFVWIPCSCAISHWDRKRMREEAEEEDWMHANNTSLISGRDPRILIRPSSTIQRRPLGPARVRHDDRSDLPPKPGYRDEVRFRPGNDDNGGFGDERRYVPRRQPGAAYYRPPPARPPRTFQEPTVARTNHPDGLERPEWPKPVGPNEEGRHFIYPDPKVTTGTNV